MEKDRDFVGTGDPRLDEEGHLGGADMPGTPGYESEAAFRHRNFPEAEVPEIRSIQLAPGTLDDEESESQVHFETLKFNQETEHRSR